MTRPRALSRPPALRRLVGVAALVFASAATAASDATADDLRNAASWCASAAFVARGWRDGSLGERYTRRTLSIAIDELARIDRSVARRDRVAAADAVHDVADAIGLVRRAVDAVDAGDAAAIAPLAGDLERHAGTLAARRATRTSAR